MSRLDDLLCPPNRPGSEREELRDACGACRDEERSEEEMTRYLNFSTNVREGVVL